MPVDDRLQQAGLALGLEAADPQALGSAARAAGIPVERLVQEMIGSGAVDELPAAAAAYMARTLEAQAEILGDVAHDLRGPLSGMLGIVQTMRRRTLEAELAAEFMKRLEASCHRMEALIADVMTLAQVDASKLALRLEEVDVPAAMQEALRAFDGEVVLEIGDAFPPLRTDRTRLVQVVARLVDNALRYSSSPPRLAVQRAGEAVTFRVVDDGPGITEEHHQRIFDRFFQVPGDRRRGRSGLGLAAGSEVARALGGDLVVQSVPGAGATFVLTLPTS